MLKFKAGDKIKCIDARCTDNMTQGKVYTVTKVMNDGDPYVLNDVGEQDWWAARRFELVSEYLTPEQVLQYFKEGRQDELEYIQPNGVTLDSMSEYTGLKYLFEGKWRVKSVPKTIDYYGTELPKPITKAEAKKLGLTAVWKLILGLGNYNAKMIINLDLDIGDNLYFKSESDALVVREAILKPFKQ